MIRQAIAHWVEQALQKARMVGALEWQALPPFEVAPPRNKQFGDYATNVALLLAKQVGVAPQEVAHRIREHLPPEAEEWVEKVEIAGGGFLNFYLKRGWTGAVVRQILCQGEQFGTSSLGQGKRVLIEFVSANPTGPLSIGHGRNAVLGDTLARLLTALGYQVEREFYLNDATNSTQIQNFAHSVLIRFRQLLGEQVEMPEEGYQGEYVMEIAQQILEQHGPEAAESQEDTASEPVLTRFENWAKSLILKQQEEDLRDFGVVFDRWFSEQSLHRSGAVQKALQRLREQGYAYEAEGALWLKATCFGDEKDRVLVRANGLPTYLAADVAYHLNKYERGYDWLIDIWGTDHHGYLARMKAAVEALGYDPHTLTILVYQLVRLFRGGELVRMSKRTGDLVTLREVLNEAGKDATRFFYLMRSHDSPLDFDLDLAKRQSEENPVYYVQYAHARICSLLRKAVERGVAFPSVEEADLSLLGHETEVALMKRLSELPDEVQFAGLQLAPHRLTAYALDVARAFHLFYTHCRVLGAEPEVSKARLLLVEATRIVLKNTLHLMGISAPEQMVKEETETEGESHA